MSFGPVHKKEFNIMIGERTAEEIKVNVGTAFPDGRNETMEIRGRDLLSGLPKTIRITSSETREALADPVAMIVHCVRIPYRKIPRLNWQPISWTGIVMTGGGSLLHGLDRLIKEETGIPTYLAEDPLSCVALGTGKALDSLANMEDSLTTLKKGSVASWAEMNRKGASVLARVPLRLSDK